MKARILLFLILTGSLFYQQSFAQMSNSNEPASVSSDSSSGVQTTYNILNLPSQQTSSGQTIRHSYLADGTRWKSVNASGSGFTYRGSFEYDGAGTTLKSVGFSEGRIHATSSGTLTDVAYHIKDHLGSVRAIVNASGTVTERNDYHPYGARHSNSSLTKASGNRWRFSGKEEFDDAFGLPQSDFGARFYDRTAWSSLDPLAEKYYSLSPYAFCAGNPIIFVDKDGRVIDTAIDAISISLGVKSLISNIQAGNVRAAVFDGVGVAVDAVAAAIPFIPGGVGILRNGAKLVDAADDVADAVKTTVKVHGNSKLSTKAQHAYDIFDTETNTIVKTGVSSGPISKKGKSYRAEKQVREWNKKENTSKYESVITHKETQGEGSREKILQYERERADMLRKVNHLNTGKHKYP